MELGRRITVLNTVSWDCFKPNAKRLCRNTTASRLRWTLGTDRLWKCTNCSALFSLRCVTNVCTFQLCICIINNSFIWIVPTVHPPHRLPRPPTLPPKPQRMRKSRPRSIFTHKLFNGNLEAFIQVPAICALSVRGPGGLSWLLTTLLPRFCLSPALPSLALSFSFPCLDLFFVFFRKVKFDETVVGF